MTKAEWNACTDPTPMLESLRGKASERKLRLFACACCRRIWNCLTDDKSRKAVEVAEQHADGAVDYETLERACGGTNKPRFLVRDLRWPDGGMVADYVSAEAARIVDVVTEEGRQYTEEREAQCRLLREIYGNQVTASSIQPARRKANGGRVLKIAWGIYDDRAFDRLPLLADALEGAGCTDVAILSHCLAPGEHVRGCWVVDLLLGKR
jgi:hypothetical protein